MDGSWWEIEQGADFSISIKAMQSVLRARALVKSPWFCEIRTDGPRATTTRMWFRFVPREESAP